jgi:hypothetical protein
MTVKETTSPKSPNPLYTIEAVEVDTGARRVPPDGGIERGTGAEDVAATANRAPTNTMIRVVGEVKAALGRLKGKSFDQAAYHGSPHIFDQLFSCDGSILGKQPLIPSRHRHTGEMPANLARDGPFPKPLAGRAIGANCPEHAATARLGLVAH